MTDSKLTACVRAVASIVGGVSGINKAPDFPIESLNVFPFAVTYPVTGEFEGVPARTMTELHNIIVEVHVNKKMLPLDVEKLLKYVEAVPEALMTTYNLNNTCETFSGITYKIKTVEWGNQDTLVIEFTIRNIKIMESLDD